MSSSIPPSSSEVQVAPASADSTTHGAIYRPIHGERSVKVYPIQEHELKTIGICNTMVTLCSSVGALFVALLGGCLWDTSIAEQPCSRTGVAFMVVCAICALVAFFAAGYFWWQKKTEIEEIKHETKV